MSPNILFTLGCLLATLLINRLGRRKMLIHSVLCPGVRAHELTAAKDWLSFAADVVRRQQSTGWRR